VFCLKTEYTGNNYSAPALIGCVSTADTLDEMRKNITEAIAFHIESSLEFNDPIPDVFKGPYELKYILL
jgi:predicted RNase H-like HicB family nuclease